MLLVLALGRGERERREKKGRPIVLYDVIEEKDRFNFNTQGFKHIHIFQYSNIPMMIK